MSSYFNTRAEHVRICILRLLVELPGYEANNSEIADGVKLYGFKIGGDLVDAQIAWLAEQGLVEMRQVVAGLAAVTLTARGLDVALGHASVPGVKKPGPR